MSEWLDLMLEEIERKKNEALDAAREAARRESESRPDDTETARRPQEK
jgi:hypothetical protein